MEISLNTFGVALSLDNEGFVISNHEGAQRIPVDGIDTIRLSKGAQITSDAILFAIDNEIEVIFTDRGGYPKGRVWSPKYGSISTIRKGQLKFIESQEAVNWIKDVLISKIDNQQAMITLMRSDNGEDARYYNTAISRIERIKMKIMDTDAELLSDVASLIRGWEGACSKIYFDTFSRSLPEQYRFETRSQHPAVDPANAMLNYGYGILYGKTEAALIDAGIDPYIGVLHRDEYNRAVLAYDFIEPYRVWVEYVIYSILKQEALSETCYSRNEDGSVWLENLGRRMVIQGVNDYLEEVVKLNRKERSRATHIVLDAQRLAQIFKNNC